MGADKDNNNKKGFTPFDAQIHYSTALIYSIKKLAVHINSCI